MSIFRNFRLRFAPPRLMDPDFGQIVFIYISNAPERSYWEGEWRFPATGNTISIALPGNESGPRPDGRTFYLELPGRFEEILAASRPQLAGAWKRFFAAPLSEDIFNVLTLTGFDVEDPAKRPIRWEASFETSGEKWIAIRVPFIGEAAQTAVVDS